MSARSMKLHKDIHKIKQYSPLLASVLAFILVFNFFYNVLLPPPFTVASIEQFTPKAYVAPDDQPIKIIVKPTYHGSLRVFEFWYLWPYDGWVKKEDWEPVIVYVKDDHVYAVAFRIHYNWRVSFDPPIVNGTHVRIAFAYRYHTPLLTPPPHGWVEVKTKPEVGQPPEKIDHNMIIGIPNPLDNAFTAGLIYGLISAVVTYFSTRWFVKQI